MSDIIVPGFKSSELIAELNKSFESFSPEEKAKLLKQVCISLLYEFDTKSLYYNINKHVGQWHLPIHNQKQERQRGDFHY